MQASLPTEEQQLATSVISSSSTAVFSATTAAAAAMYLARSVCHAPALHRGAIRARRRTPSRGMCATGSLSLGCQPYRLTDPPPPHPPRLIIR
jgi:hypothetical protein